MTDWEAKYNELKRVCMDDVLEALMYGKHQNTAVLALCEAMEEPPCEYLGGWPGGQTEEEYHKWCPDWCPKNKPDEPKPIESPTLFECHAITAAEYGAMVKGEGT